MNLLFIADLCALVGAMVGFVYGIRAFFMNRTPRKKAADAQTHSAQKAGKSARPKKSPLYAKMITGAVGCMMFSRLSKVVRSIAGFANHAFQLHSLGYIGVFLFLLTANAGIMDGLADDRSKAYRPYRLAAFAAPFAVICLFLPIALGDFALPVKVTDGVVTVFIAAASYFNLKHAIFPDVDFGVIRCVKGYNWLAVACGLLYMGEMVATAYGADRVALVLCVLIGLDSAFILPMLKRGIERWKI